jgi:sulfur-carrier protein
MAEVKFFAGLREAAGTKETSLEAASLRDLLNKLDARFPRLQGKVWDGAALRPHVVITINGQTLSDDQGLDTPLNPDDTIAIFPPIAGGCHPYRSEEGDSE